MTKTISIPDNMLYFLNEKARYKVAYGGRGSGKSHTIARIILIKALESPIRVLNVRHVQKSIKESVHQLYCDLIKQYELDRYFVITRESIIATNGSMFIFKGIQNDLASSVKSLEGINICWVEEAQMVTEASWEILTPTIREKNSEIWVSFNPLHEDDAVYQRFIVNKRDDAIVKKVNYSDNPWFPEVLRKELDTDISLSYERYRHVWGGELKTDNLDAPFNHVRVEKFDYEEGMSCFIDPSYAGKDMTGITFGYWHDGKPYVWVYEQDGNFAETYKILLHRLEAKGVSKVYLEDNGDQGVLATMIKQWVNDGDSTLVIKPKHTSQKKLDKIWSSVGAVAKELVVNISSDYDCVLNWHEKAEHDDGIDSLAMWLQQTAKRGV